MSPEDIKHGRNPESQWGQKDMTEQGPIIVKHGVFIDREFPDPANVYVFLDEKGKTFYFFWENAHFRTPLFCYPMSG